MRMESPLNQRLRRSPPDVVYTPIDVTSLHIYRLFSLPCPGAKQLRRPIQQLGLPLRDLVRVHIELACQLRKCPVAAHCGKSHLRLELCRVVTAGSSAHLSLLSPRALSCPQSGSDSTYPPVQISGATSFTKRHGVHKLAYHENLRRHDLWSHERETTREMAYTVEGATDRGNQLRVGGLVQRSALTKWIPTSAGMASWRIDDGPRYAKDGVPSDGSGHQFDVESHLSPLPRKRESMHGMPPRLTTRHPKLTKTIKMRKTEQMELRHASFQALWNAQASKHIQLFSSL